MTAVVLDTDIGTDIDDTWALAMLLGCPELDLRLVLTSTGDTAYRARVAAGILAAGGHEHIPVAVGLPTVVDPRFDFQPQGRFADEIALNLYPGGVRPDGIRALIECVMGASERVTIISIGPLTNIAAAIAREPAITTKARLIAMAGSIRCGYQDSPGPIPEYNVVRDIPASRAALSAPWDVTVTPLDTCGSVILRDEQYAKLKNTPKPLLEAVIRNYEEWCEAVDAQNNRFAQPVIPPEPDNDHALSTQGWSHVFERETSILFDTVAVYLAYDESFVEIETLPIEIVDDGTMRVRSGATELRVASAWRDAPRFLDHLVDRLMGNDLVDFPAN